MPRLFALLFLLTAAVAESGCASQPPPQAAKPPPAAERPSTRATPRRAPAPTPKLIAPPPAYGNKVVMAVGDRTTADN